MRIKSFTKALSFVAFIAAAILSSVGYKESIVGTIGCVSAFTFSIIVFYDIYKAWQSV